MDTSSLGWGTQETVPSAPLSEGYRRTRCRLRSFYGGVKTKNPSWSLAGTAEPPCNLISADEDQKRCYDI
jgi:hypothetical protein